MRFFYDRTGFPLVQPDRSGLALSLLPVTKVQFERFLAEPNEFGDAWYEQILSVNPRVSWQRFEGEQREQLFLTGILPAEALAFARWLGEGFDLPTVDEWRKLAQLLSLTPLPAGVQETLRSCPMHRAAHAILQGLLRQLEPESWGELALLRGGLIEWVRVGQGFAGLGAPRPQFYPNTFNPLHDDPVRPLREQRLPYFGFRLVYRPCRGE